MERQSLVEGPSGIPSQINIHPRAAGENVKAAGAMDPVIAFADTGSAQEEKARVLPFRKIVNAVQGIVVERRSICHQFPLICFMIEERPHIRPVLISQVESQAEAIGNIVLDMTAQVMIETEAIDERLRIYVLYGI